MKESNNTKKENSEVGVKKAVDLLRKGATMLDEACPVCSGPLFQLNDDILCPHCNKKVLIVSDEAEVQKVQKDWEKDSVLSSLDQAICTQLKYITDSLLYDEEIDSNDLYQIGRLTIVWLEALEKLKRIRSQ